MKKTIITTLVATSIALAPLATFAQAADEMMIKKDAKNEESMMKSDVMKKDETMEKKPMSLKEKAMMKKKAMMEKAKMLKEKAMMKKKAMMEKASLMKEKAMMKKEDVMKGSTGYMILKKTTIEDLKKAIVVGKKNIVFFHATWCPTCKAVDSEIMKAGIKEGYNIIRVDYDESTALKKMYGVTTQHTFVQVDDMGAMITSWRGGDLVELYKNIK